MLKALNLPKGAKEELNYAMELVEKIQRGEPLWNDDDQEGADPEDPDHKKLTDEDKTMMELFGEGKFHIIPSFFRTLIYLKKQKREFAVVFRNFASKELDKIVWEFNRFCSGTHPCYSGRNGTPLIRFDGSKNAKDLRIRDPSQKAFFVRASSDAKDAKLVQGTYVRPDCELEGEDQLAEALEADDYEDCVLQREPIQQYLGILDTLKKYSSMAISDDHENWQANDYHREVAKLLFIDQGEYNTQHIFFDDNADEGEDCIVDVRDVVTQEIVEYDKFINLYAVKVEPHRAILEPDYFIKQIEIAEQGRDDEVERIEAGVTEAREEDPEATEEVKEATSNEWAELQKLPNEQYLQRTVLPVLYQAMRIVDQQRPVAPAEYLALYMLKHQDMIKLPPKPVDE